MLVAGAVEYFREHMAIGDYLAEKGAAQMIWIGKDAARLGLAGVCQLGHFESLCSGRHPSTGRKLMVRDKGGQRRVCYFAQLSPPKDVSVLYLVGGDGRIGKWWQEAVAETLHEMEDITATRVRRAGQNEDRTTGSMIGAMVTHDANRALDPQLHSHICLMNLTYDKAEARWKGVQPSGFYRHQGYLREVCYNKLAARMVAAGYELEPGKRIGFAVKGLPEELRVTFSKRRREILQLASQAGATSQDALQAIALASRADKRHATAETLRAGWVKEAGSHFAALQGLIAGASGRRRFRSVNAVEALQSAEAHVFERKSVVDDRLLLREALIVGRGEVSLVALKRALSVREKSGDLLRVNEEIAAREGLEAEREFTSWANSGLKKYPPLGGVTVEKDLAADQVAAIRGVLSSRSTVVVLQGDAGTGKTTCLRSIVAGIEKTGRKVFACAPSSGATDVLRQELTDAADTVQRLLANESLQRESKGRILLVDEAGLLSVRQMRDLCRLAARNGNRLLLVGDIKQHGPVEAGDALRCLQEFARVPVVRLTEIRRQRDLGYRKAVARLAAGDAYGAFGRFDALGAVRELGDPKALFSAAADDFVRAVQAGKSCLAISPVWSEISVFTTVVRSHLRAAGRLGGEDRLVDTVELFQWTREERRRIQNYRQGDVLVFHRDEGAFRKFDQVAVERVDGTSLVLRCGDGQERKLEPRVSSGFGVGSATQIPVSVGDRLLIRANAKPAGLRNGDLVDVASVDANGDLILKDGRVIPPWFRGFKHGYATTTHASQGKTVDHGILLMADEAIAAADLAKAYVANSRFRCSQMIYTTDRKAAREAMMRPSHRKLSLELVSEAEVPAHGGWRGQWLTRLRSWSTRAVA